MAKFKYPKTSSLMDVARAALQSAVAELASSAPPDPAFEQEVLRLHEQIEQTGLQSRMPIVRVPNRAQLKEIVRKDVADPDAVELYGEVADDPIALKEMMLNVATVNFMVPQGSDKAVLIWPYIDRIARTLSPSERCVPSARWLVVASLVADACHNLAKNVTRGSSPTNGTYEFATAAANPLTRSVLLSRYPQQNSEFESVTRDMTNAGAIPPLEQFADRACQDLGPATLVRVLRDPTLLPHDVDPTAYPAWRARVHNRLGVGL